MSLARRVRRLFALPRAEVWDLVRAQYALAWAQVLVWTRPVGTLVGETAAAAEIGDVPPPSERARALALAVERAAKHGVFRPLCLVRSIALQRLLLASGISGSRIRIGVRRETGEFDAHAWVELGGRVLGDRTWHTRRYAQLADLRVERESSPPTVGEMTRSVPS